MKGNRGCCAPWLIDNANTNIFPNNDSAYNIGQGMNEESGTKVITQHDNNEYFYTRFSLNLFPAQRAQIPTVQNWMPVTAQVQVQLGQQVLMKAFRHTETEATTEVCPSPV